VAALSVSSVCQAGSGGRGASGTMEVELIGIDEMGGEQAEADPMDRAEEAPLRSEVACNDEA
jgi:hypothetical protein